MRDNSRMVRALKTIRDRRGLTQEALAALADTSNSTISRLEDGTDQYSGKTLERLAQALGYPAFVLLMTDEQFATYELGQDLRNLTPEMRDYLEYRRSRTAS